MGALFDRGYLSTEILYPEILNIEIIIEYQNMPPTFFYSTLTPVCNENRSMVARQHILSEHVGGAGVLVST